ncbi:MAG: glycosyltransferase family 4 protein [Actinoplanes sp.]
MSNCRVLVVEYGAGLWGAQRYLLRLRPLLQKYGIELILAAPPGSALAEAWQADNGRWFALPELGERGVRGPAGGLSPRLVLGELRRTWRSIVNLARAARSADVHIIHGNSHWTHLEVALAGRLARRRTTLHLHEENEPDLLGRVRGVAVLLAGQTIAVSDAVARSLPRWARNRVTVVRNGVDTEAIRPAAPPPATRAQLTGDPAAPLVLTMSRLDPRKGVDRVIRAVATLPHVRLAIAGAPALDPANGDRLRELADGLLGDRVRFLGERRDVADLLHAADILVLASKQEGLPLSILEAQAAGTPVVAYPTAGIPEVITHERTGLLVDADDLDDLAESIDRMAGDARLRHEIGVRARAQVERDGDIRHQARRLAELTLALAGRRE